ncbi:MAG TPA: hypothetical protein VN043_07980 [Rhodanobacter sp.]|nr:hypothetical protein [Rhodanobacter sp.]
MSPFDAANDTYVLAGDRRALLDDVESWLQHNFPIPSRSTP